jgi:hypothetical protein
MKFDQYLNGMMEIKGKKEPTPSSLELPDEILALFAELYKATESKGKEHGCPLFYDPEATKAFFPGPIKDGNAVSMNIPKSNFDNNYGNVHAHPSASIGHKDIFCVHSLQDMLTFEHEIQAKKPFFVQFVASGPKIYAVIYVKGLSTFSEDMKKFANELKDKAPEEAKAFMIKKYFGDQDKYYDKLASFAEEEDAEKFVKNLKKDPAVLKILDKVSRESLLRVTRQFRYAFYEGDAKKGTLSLRK